jgi:hypothetical protein
MSEAETGLETKTREGRIDSVKPPASLPEGSPFERMRELTRRILGVPKNEAIPPKTRLKRKHR